MFAAIAFKGLDAGAMGIAIQSEVIAIFRQGTQRSCRRFLLELQKVRQNRGLAISGWRWLSFVEYREKALVAPLKVGFGINEQPAGFGRLQTRWIIDGQFAATARYAWVAPKLQLTGCIVTGMTDHTAAIKNWLDLATKVRCEGNGWMGHVKSLRVRGAIARIPFTQANTGTSNQNQSQKKRRQRFEGHKTMPSVQNIQPVRGHLLGQKTLEAQANLAEVALAFQKLKGFDHRLQGISLGNDRFQSVLVYGPNHFHLLQTAAHQHSLHADLL